MDEILSNQFVQPEHAFIINNYIGIEQECIDEVKKAVIAIWQKHFPRKETTFDLSFYQAIVNDEGDLADRVAEYNQYTDQFSFGLDNIDSSSLKQIYDFSKKKFFFLIFAHEAMHKVQIARGDKIESAPINFTEEEILDQADAVYEIEAWEEAFEALSIRFPNYGLKIGIQGRNGMRFFRTAIEQRKQP